MIHFKMIWFDKFWKLFEELVEIYLMEHYYFKDYLIKFQMDFDLFQFFILKLNLKKKSSWLLTWFVEKLIKIDDLNKKEKTNPLTSDGIDDTFQHDCDRQCFSRRIGFQGDRRWGSAEALLWSKVSDADLRKRRKFFFFFCFSRLRWMAAELNHRPGMPVA